MRVWSSANFFTSRTNDVLSYCTQDVKNKRDECGIIDTYFRNYFRCRGEQLCKTFDWLTGSYIEYVKEDDFLLNPSKYIDNAYEKSKNDGSGYRLQRTRKGSNSIVI